jgi:hypothetical protein
MLTLRKPLAVAGMVGVGLFSMNASVHATTITQLLNVPGGTNANTPFIVNDIPYNLFNSSLGTLTSVTLELTTTDTVSSEVVNINSTPEVVTNASASFPLTIYGPPTTTSPPYDLTTYLATTTITAGPYTGIAAPDFATTVMGTQGGTTDSGIVPVPMADWLGNWETPGGGVSGTNILFASGAGNYLGSAGSGVFFGGVASVSGTLTLIYTYQSNGTPEPGALALLLASASVSLVGIRRRRAIKK